MAGLFVRHSGTSPVQGDFDCLLRRMRERLYPETAQVLAFYWLKTIYSSGYERRDWEALLRLLKQNAADESLKNIAQWMRDADVFKSGKRPSKTRVLEFERSEAGSSSLVPYMVRMLNEWLPLELARMLENEPEANGFDEPGIPVITYARALERLLLRARMSRPTLESLLSPGLFSPHDIYPADYEILRDVVLFLLGRTAAPEWPVLPATLLCTAPGVALPADYRKDVEQATFSADENQLRVPITSAESMRVLQSDPVRITSVVVTMDGRWWRAGELQSGDQNAILYYPAGRLRMDLTHDHARVTVPWPEARLNWAGPVEFTSPIELFGRQWHIAQWDQEADQTWVTLEYAGVLPTPRPAPVTGNRPRRARPANVDVAWGGLEHLIEECISNKNGTAIERLRRHELIPLGRALVALAQTVLDRAQRKPDAIEQRLSAVRFHSAALEESYGKVAWRVLPERVQQLLLRASLTGPLNESLLATFDDVPAPKHASATPPHAA